MTPKKKITREWLTLKIVEKYKSSTEVLQLLTEHLSQLELLILLDTVYPRSFYKRAQFFFRSYTQEDIPHAQIFRLSTYFLKPLWEKHHLVIFCEQNKLRIHTHKEHTTEKAAATDYGQYREDELMKSIVLYFNNN